VNETRKRFRVSIYLPKEFNPDPKRPELPRKPIPPKLHDDTLEEIEKYLEKRFGIVGLNIETFIRKHVTGQWKGMKDNIMVLHLDGEFTDSDFEWFKNQKEIWKVRFQQEELYIVYYEMYLL
jgi:hypothetical protein